MVVIVQDTFTDANGTNLSSHTSDSGHSWSFDQGNLAPIVSNRLENQYNYSSGGAESVVISSGTSASVMQDISVLFSALTIHNSEYFGLVGKYNPSTNTGYRLNINRTSANNFLEIQIMLEQNGSRIVLASHGSMTVQTGTLKIELRDGTQKSYFNDTLLSSTSNTVVTGTGNVGLYLQNSSTSVATVLDDFIYDNVAEPLQVISLGESATLLSAEQQNVRNFGNVVFPSADKTDGQWLTEIGGTSLFSSIDEEATTVTDYVESGSLTSVPDVFEVSFAPISHPGKTTEHYVGYTISKDMPTQTPVTIVVSLMEGSTTVASWTHENVPSDPVTYTQLLTEQQAGTIGSYGNLSLRFSAIKG